MKERFAYWCATFSFIGRLPYAPGTWASLAAIPILWLLSNHTRMSLLAFFPFLLVSIWSSTVTAGQLHAKDPAQVVIDEVCGMWTSFLFVPIRWQTLLAGFFLFRFFDVVKPQPVRAIEKLPGGFGIVFDDVAAGIYTNVILQLAVRYAHL